GGDKAIGAGIDQWTAVAGEHGLRWAAIVGQFPEHEIRAKGQIVAAGCRKSETGWAADGAVVHVGVDDRRGANIGSNGVGVAGDDGIDNSEVASDRVHAGDAATAKASIGGAGAVAADGAVLNDEEATGIGCNSTADVDAGIAGAGGVLNKEIDVFVGGICEVHSAAVVGGGV